MSENNIIDIDTLFRNSNYNQIIDIFNNNINTPGFNVLDIFYRALIYNQDCIFQYCLNFINPNNIIPNDDNEVFMLNLVLDKAYSLFYDFNLQD